MIRGCKPIDVPSDPKHSPYKNPKAIVLATIGTRSCLSGSQGLALAVTPAQRDRQAQDFADDEPEEDGYANRVDHVGSNVPYVGGGKSQQLKMAKAGFCNTTGTSSMRSPPRQLIDLASAARRFRSDTDHFRLLSIGKI